MLYQDEAIGAFCGPGGTGKGVTIGVAEMLAGEANVMAVAGGPPRLATSQFALSPLGEGCDLLTMADMPQAPGSWEHAAVARAEWQKGSTLLKTISGSGRIQVETKGKPQKSMQPRVSVLADSNFEWDWMRTDAEADSWYRRVVFVPFNEQIPEGETIPKLYREIRAGDTADSLVRGASVLGKATSGIVHLVSRNASVPSQSVQGCGRGQRAGAILRASGSRPHCPVYQPC